MPTSLCGERVVLHAARALSWPREKTLFVADVHLGKGAAFRAGGIPLPRGTTANDLRRLDALIAESGASRLVVLGDFLHAKAGRVAALSTAFVAWRARHATLDVVLVRGNHDAHAGDPP
ncbi:MAG TPA: metallophosphoesterase, partial [Casimicrobiaceae bacterium]|nr:metallophosphoesterase [Casimicrobiaceae bacterium]